jgi:hypothetical protein
MPEIEAKRVGILEKRICPLVLGCADLWSVALKPGGEG